MDAVIWHDLECGSYEQDLRLWLALAQAQGSSHPRHWRWHRAGHAPARTRWARGCGARHRRGAPVRARASRRRTPGADRRRRRPRFRPSGAQLRAVRRSDADDPAVWRRARARRGFCDPQPDICARRACWRSRSPKISRNSSGRTATSEPLPDMVELDGAVYFSQPTAIRRQGRTYVLERVRETITLPGTATGARIASRSIASRPADF